MARVSDFFSFFKSIQVFFFLFFGPGGGGGGGGGAGAEWGGA